MYFCGQFNLDDWDSTAGYVILDDFNFKFFPQWKSFLGAQKQFVLTDKYRKKRTVQWGKPCIVLGNPGSESDPTGVVSRTEMGWIDANCDYVRVDVPLF